MEKTRKLAAWRLFELSLVVVVWLNVVRQAEISVGFSHGL